MIVMIKVKVIVILCKLLNLRSSTNFEYNEHLLFIILTERNIFFSFNLLSRSEGFL